MLQRVKERFKGIKEWMYNLPDSVWIIIIFTGIAVSIIFIIISGMYWWQRSEVGSQISDIGGQKSEVGDRISDIGNQNSEIRDLNSESWQTYRNEEYGFEFEYPGSTKPYAPVEDLIGCKEKNNQLLPLLQIYEDDNILYHNLRTLKN